MKTKITLEKILNWEYWPTPMFYVPNIPYALYLAIKANHGAFFSAVNPAIKSSGNGTESKYETIQLVPKELRPNSILVSPNIPFETLLSEIHNKGIKFPLIAKPDIGFRGLLVQKINTSKDLERYLKKYPITLIIQEFLDYKNECGVFYYRNPKSNKGYISSLTLKRFLSVTGDGTSTLQALILKDSRARLYIDLFKEIHGEDLNIIPKNHKEIKLTAIGNHSKGTQFINGNDKISEKLVSTFDKLSTSIEGWYYGRIDLKYNTLEELEAGLNFKILEINGIIAEPTHIYDSASYSYFKALKAIRSHWKSLYEIAVINHKEHKIPYKSSRVFLSEMLELHQYTKKINRLSK